MIKKIIIPIMFSNILFANNINISTSNSDLKITIYNKNLAFINDKREAVVNKGVNKLIYEGVPRNVISESVIPTFNGVHTKLYSQNYIYDIVNLQSMLKNSIDKEVEYIDNKDKENVNPEILKGKLLAISPVIIKNKKTGKIISLNSQTQVIFNSVPKNMITKPSLVWNVNNNETGKLNIDLKYLTTGISWKSDYVLNLKKDNLDLNGWITIKNNSGVSYENAQITCLAGDVNTVASINKGRGIMMKKSIMMDDSTSEAVKEESFSGYHIYKIPFKENILNRQKKQIVFIDKKEIKYSQYGKNINNNFSNYGKQKLVFSNIIEFINNKENNMGIPLPSGTIRMYKEDSKKETHFIGEDYIKNIPNKEKVKLHIGTMFDVVGEKKISKYIANKYKREVETTYEIRNKGKEDVVVKIEERIPVYGRDIKIKTSCEGICSFEKKTAFYREYTIKLKKEEIYKFTSEFKVSFN